MVAAAPPERHIALEGSSNLRDIGGYRAADGRQVRWNMVYRSGALARLSAADWTWMRERDIGAVCDLRSDQERAIAPTAWADGDRPRRVDVVYEAELVFAPLVGAPENARVGELNRSLYAVFPQLLAPSLRRMSEALLASHVPLIVHCSAGQDRTGFAVAVLLTALGVPRETVHADYLLSTAHRRVENEVDRAMLAASPDTNMVARFYRDLQRRKGDAAFAPRPLLDALGEPLLLESFAAIDREWGSLDGYLDGELGLDAKRIAALRDACLEDAPASGA